MTTAAERTRAWRASSPKWRAYCEANKEKKREYDRIRNAADPVKNRQKTARWAQENPEKTAASKRAWAEAHPGRTPEQLIRHAASQKKRIASTLNRVPAWADLKEIERVYAEARELSEFTEMQWHVDHVIPLQGRRVSGLHVHTNLQLLPGVENFRKGNRFEPG